MYVTLLSLLISANTIPIGDVAPSFSATDCKGAQHDLQTMLQDGPVIVTFLPSTFCAQCSLALTTLGANAKVLADHHVGLITFSGEDNAQTCKIQALLGQSYPFVSDADRKVFAAYQTNPRLFTALAIERSGKVRAWATFSGVNLDAASVIDEVTSVVRAATGDSVGLSR